MDRLTKYGHFVALKHPFRALTMAAQFVKVVRLHGFPTSIVSNRDKVFMYILERNVSITADPMA